MSWQPELDELEQRRTFAQAMGGPDKVKRQHDAGRLTVRERIDRMVDGGAQAFGGLSTQMRRLQTGYARSYALTMVLGALVVGAVLILTQLG